MTSIATATYLEEIDNLIAKTSLLKHPFYQAWSRGELSLDSLRDYACQYYQHVKAFPTYLSAVHAQTDEVPTRRHILENLMDEEAGSPNHLDLWLQFGQGLGVSNAEMESTQPWPETANLIKSFRSICSDRGTAAGLAALYAYESQIPAVAESKIAGLKQFYSIDNPAALAYFEVHKEADIVHSRVERDLLAKHIYEDNRQVVLASASETLNALWGMLDGVCRRHGIEC